MKRAFLLLVILISSASYAEEGNFVITSEHLEAEGSVYNASGAVVYQKGDAVMKSERARYDRATGEFFAEGNVQYEDSAKTITAYSAHLNTKNDTGVLYDAEVLFKLDNYRIKGPEMRQTAKGRYFLRTATITTCNPPRPAWCFSGRDVDIIVGDRLEAKHATMRVRGVPALYTPYLWLPILTDRKTGLLFPSFGYRQTAGFYFRQPFYWVIADNKDATFYLDIHTNLGIGEGGEYRYLYRNAEGSINLYHTEDNRADRDFYELNVLHRQRGRRLTGFLSLNLVNEKDFYELYEPYLERSSKRYAESTAEGSVSAGKARLYILGRYFIELRDDIGQSTVLQRLPEAGLFISPVKAGPLLFTASASAANFWRESAEQPQGSQPRGRRLDFSLRASNSIGRGVVLSQTAVLRESLYSLETEELSRNIFDYQARLGMIAYRRYGGMEHAFEPSLSYRLIEPGPDYSRPPLLDNIELISRASRLEAALFNRLLDSEAELVTLRVTGAYEFLNLQRPFTPVVVDLFAQKLLTFRASAAYDPYDEEITSANSDIGVGIWRLTFTGGQNYARGVGITQYTAGIAYDGPRLSLGSRLLYDPIEEMAKEVSGSLALREQCWGFTLSVVKRPEDYGVFFAVNLAGLGSTQTLTYGPSGFQRLNP